MIKRWAWVVILFTIAGIVYITSGLLSNNPWAVLTLPCGLGIFMLWLIFFAQFIVPLNNLTDRFKIFLRVLFSGTPLHGQYIYLENGTNKDKPEPIQTDEERQRKGWGTAVLDTTSAAILKNSVELTRAIGPGVTFLDFSETLGDTINLRPRKTFLGPFDNDKIVENPFAPQGSDEEVLSYKARLQRREQTRGYTRDHVEVVPNIFIKFRLDSQWYSNGSVFGFNPNAVLAALTSRDINARLPVDSSDKLENWDILPGKIASDIWRELLVNFSLQQLFTRVNSQGQTGIELINNVLRQRMTRPTAPQIAINPNGDYILTLPNTSREYFMLKRRGIQVTVATVLNLRFEDSIENTLVQNWASTWLARSRADREQRLQIHLTSNAGAQSTALYNFARSTSLPLTQAPLPLNANQILTNLLQGTGTLITSSPALLNIAEDERQAVADIFEWLAQE